MFNYAGAFVDICIVRPGDFVYIRLIMLVHLLGRPGEFVYIRLIMLVHLLGYALWGPAHLFTYVYTTLVSRSARPGLKTLGKYAKEGATTSISTGTWCSGITPA